MSDPNAPQGEQPNEGSTPVPPPPTWGGVDPAAPQPPSVPPTAPPVQPPAAPAYGQPAATPPSYGQPPATPPSYGQPSASTPPPASPYGQDGEQPPAYGQPAATPPAYGQPSPTPPANPYGAAPDPSGAYPPPPAGGGFPPPPQNFPPAPAYSGGPGDYNAPADLGSAFSWAFNKFGKNAGSAIVAGLLWFLAIAIVVAIATFAIALPILAGTGDSAGMAALATVGGIAGAILVFFSMFAVFVSGLAMINGYLAVADGKQVSIGDFFVFRNVGAGLLAALLIAAANAVVNLIPGVGWLLSIVVSFFVTYAMYFVVDRNQDAISAIRSSFDVASKNVVPTILLVLSVYVITGIGAALCGVGLIFALPLTGLLQVYMYRRLTGQPVAPAIP